MPPSKNAKIPQSQRSRNTSRSKVKFECHLNLVTLVMIMTYVPTMLHQILISSFSLFDFFAWTHTQRDVSKNLTAVHRYIDSAGTFHRH